MAKKQEMFQNMTKNGKLRNYTKDECYHLMNQRYGSATTEFIDQLLCTWSDNHPTQQHFRDALNEIKANRE